MYIYFGLETNIILLSEIGLISMCFAFYKQGNVNIYPWHNENNLRK